LGHFKERIVNNGGDNGFQTKRGRLIENDLEEHLRTEKQSSGEEGTL